MKKIIVTITVIAILLIAGIFIIKSSTGNIIKESEVKEFTVKAFRFGYSPDIIEVNKGDKVKIIIENTDTLHGIRIPDLDLRGDDVLEFTADKQGEFTWYCANMCGQGHMQMQGKLIVK
jgi:cytochrome c oxidase subunit 2